MCDSNIPILSPGFFPIFEDPHLDLADISQISGSGIKNLLEKSSDLFASFKPDENRQVVKSVKSVKYQPNLRISDQPCECCWVVHGIDSQRREN